MTQLQEGSTTQAALDRAVSRTYRRLGVYLMFAYVVAFLDRANVGYAKQALQASVGISDAVYAMGAGLFFISYSLCGFPSNLILHRIGAKIWISTLMVGWGVASMAMMFVHGSTSFYVLRLLGGMAEAGFFPGCILYLTYWFPNRIRGEIIGFYYIGVPLALVVGGPLSGALLDLHSLSLLGWQWMFLVEGFLALAMGLSAFYFLDDRPEGAKWLPADEKLALASALAGEEQERRSAGPAALLPMLRDPRVLRFVLMYGMIQMGVYAAVFYLPSQVSALMHRPQGFAVGVVTAIPWLCATAATYWLPKWGDRWNNHRNLAALTLFVTGIASFIFPTAGPLTALLMLCIAASGFVAVQPLFWTMPTGYLADTAKAGGIALVGTGNLGGFIAPPLKVWTEQHFHSPHAGLYLLAAITVFDAGLIALTSTRARAKKAHPVAGIP
jgi:MFS transporter, ACS family, inner membrane transport protein